MTVASAAVAAAPCLPDAVLPPGFDRIGETRKVENLDSGPGLSAPSSSGRCSPTDHEPAVEGQEPALSSHRVAAMKELVASGKYVPFAELRRAFKKQEAPSIESQLADLREGTAARLRRYLDHRGSMSDFARAEGITVSSAHALLGKYASRSGPLGDAIERVGASRGGLSKADLIPCTRCGLRGHVAGDPDRCYQQISLGLGGSQMRGH